MKSIVISIALTLILATSSFAQTGTWNGKLQVQGMELALVFHLDGDSAMLDVPDQWAKGIPVEVERSAFGGIKLGIPAISHSLYWQMPLHGRGSPRCVTTTGGSVNLLVM